MLSSLARTALRRATAPAGRRGMAAAPHGGGGGGAPDPGAVTYEGVTLHKPKGWHTAWAQGMAGLMWFWIFYRAYHDGDTLLYGHAPHFEHDDHHGDSDSHH